MENEKLKELREKFEKIQEMDNIDDLDTSSVIDRREPEKPKKQYENSLEGELMQELDETKDYATKISIAEKIKEVRKTKKEAATAELTEETKTEQENIKKQIDEKREKIERLKTINEELHKQEQDYIKEILENEGIMEIKKAKPSSKVYISAKEENEELMELKRERLSAIKKSEDVIKELEEQIKGLDDLVLAFDELLYEMQGLEKPQEEQSQGKPEDLKQRMDNATEKSEEQAEQLKLTFADLLREIEEIEKDSKQQEEQDRQKQEDEMWEQYRKEEEEAKKEEEKRKELEIRNEFNRKNAREDYEERQETPEERQAIREWLEGTPQEQPEEEPVNPVIIAGATAIAGTPREPRVNVVHTQRTPINSSPVSQPREYRAPSPRENHEIRPIIAERQERGETATPENRTVNKTKQETEKIELREIGFYIKPDGTPVYSAQFIKGKDFERKEVNALKYIEMAKLKDIRTLRKKGIKEPRLFDLGLNEFLLKELGEQASTEYINSMKKRAKLAERKFTMFYDFHEAGIYPLKQAIKLGYLRNLAKKSEEKELAGFWDRSNIFKRLLKEIKTLKLLPKRTESHDENKPERIEGLPEQEHEEELSGDNTIEATSEEIEQAFQELHNEPEFDIDVFIEQNKLSEENAEKYRKLSAEKADKHTEKRRKSFMDGIRVSEKTNKTEKTTNKEPEEERENRDADTNENKPKVEERQQPEQEEQQKQEELPKQEEQTRQDDDWWEGFFK